MERLAQLRADRREAVAERDEAWIEQDWRRIWQFDKVLDRIDSELAAHVFQAQEVA